jgi:hypothetical protein
MKKTSSAVLAPALLLVLVCLFSSCLKDNCRRTYKLFTPVYKKLTDLRAQVKSQPAATVTHAGKLFTSGKWIFLNEQNKGVHVIDNSNPAHPVKTGFINIPGNIDLYAKGNILYADLYSDMLAIDISDPRHISVTKFLTNTFPDKSGYDVSTNPDSINILTDWTSRDTTVDCAAVNSWYNCPNCNTFYFAASQNATAPSAAGKSNSGQAGSMARFAAVNNYMYTVSARDLSIIDISSAPNPLFVQKKTIGSDIETIFPYNNKLYIGGSSSMTVYDLQDPLNPAQLSWSGHWCSHDPVVADDKYAYVTLHEANVCGSKINQLEIYDLSTPTSPWLVKAYPLTYPQGLSKDGDLLFVCDDGLKVYNAANPGNLQLLKHLKAADTYDVIAQNGLAIVVAKDGLYQYDYSDLKNIHFLSKL